MVYFFLLSLEGGSVELRHFYFGNLHKTVMSCASLLSVCEFD